ASEHHAVGLEPCPARRPLGQAMGGADSTGRITYIPIDPPGRHVEAVAEHAAEGVQKVVSVRSPVPLVLEIPDRNYVRAFRPFLHGIRIASNVAPAPEIRLHPVTVRLESVDAENGLASPHGFDNLLDQSLG